MVDKPTASAPDTDPKGLDAAAATSARLTQYANAYADASKRNDKPAIDKIQKEWMEFAFQSYVLGQGKDVLAEMAKLSPNLVKSLAEEVQKSGVDALKEMITLQAEANKKKQTMYQDELDRMYQARLATADGPAKLMANFKGFALLLQAFGVDCSGFIAECDRAIEAEYAKVPKKNIEGLSNVNAYTVDPRKASQIARAMGEDAQRIADTAPEKARRANTSATAETGAMVGVGQATSTPTPTPTAAVAMKPVGTKYVVDAMVAIIEDKGLITSDKGRAALKAELQKGIGTAANIDGDAKTVSGQDLTALATSTGSIIKAQGGKDMDPTAAMALAKQAIDRAKGLELAAPSPKP